MTGQVINRRLVYASQDSNVEEIKRILADEVDVNVRDDKNWTPLHWASTGNNLDAVRLLLDAGADPNAKNEFGYTPLHMACAHGRLQAARLLIKHGADVNARAQSRTQNRDRWTPLHLVCRRAAVIFQDVDIARLLLERGADVNARDDEGQAPLHWACTYGRVPIARLLLERGADVNAVNDIGQDSFDQATHNGVTADSAGAPVIPILLEWGAAPSEEKLERVFQTAVDMNESNPHKGPILDWFQENRPEMYFSKFCAMDMRP